MGSAGWHGCVTRVLILSLPKRRGCGPSASGRRSAGRHDGHRCVRSSRLLRRSERDFLRMRCHFRLGCHVVRRSRWWGIPQPLAGKNEIEYGPRCKHPPRQLSLAWRSVNTAMGLDGCCCSFFVLLVEHMRTLARALAGSASSHLSEGAAFPFFGWRCFLPSPFMFLSILNWLYACIYIYINIYIFIMEGCTTNSEGEREREHHHPRGEGGESSTTPQELEEDSTTHKGRGAGLSPSPSAVSPWFFHYFFQRFFASRIRSSNFTLLRTALWTAPSLLLLPRPSSSV